MGNFVFPLDRPNNLGGNMKFLEKYIVAPLDRGVMWLEKKIANATAAHMVICSVAIAVALGIIGALFG